MASQQQFRRENKSDEQLDEVVPKLTGHFESLTVIGDEQQLPGVVQRVVETMHGGGHQTGIQEDVVRHVMEGSGNQPGSATVVHQFVGTVSGGKQTNQSNKMQADGATQLAGQKASKDHYDGEQGKSEHTKKKQYDATGTPHVEKGTQKNRPPGAPQTLPSEQSGDRYTQSGASSKTTTLEKQSSDDTKKKQQTPRANQTQQTNKNQYGATTTLINRKDAQQTSDQLNKNKPTKKNIYDKSEARTGKTTAEYAAGTVKDSASSLATNTAVENVNAGVGAVIETTAFASEKARENTASYIGKAAGVAKDAALVAGWGAAELASDTTVGLRDSMENVNAGVAGLVENTASAAEKTFGLKDAAVDMSKKGASNIGEKIVEGKDISLETGRTTVEYAGKAAGVVKDAALVGGWSAAELASDTASGVEESMENLNAGVGELIEDTAIATEIVAGKAIGLTGTVADAGKKGASYVGKTAVAGKDITLETGKTTAELVGKAAGVLKDAALAAGWSTIGLASNTAAGVTDSMKTINVGVAGLVENTAMATEVAAEKTIGLKDTIVDAGKKGASYIGDRAVAGKDITLETGKTTAEFVGKAAGVVKDAALVGGWSAAELASDTAAGVRESMDNMNVEVAGLVEGTTIGTEIAAKRAIGLADTMVSAGKKGVSYIGENVVVGKDFAAESVGQATGVVKDVALVTGWNAAELASDTTVGVKESMENLNKGVAGLVEGAAIATEVTAEKAVGLAGTVVDAGKKAAVAGKSITFETGKNTAEYVGNAAGVLKESALVEGESGGGYTIEARTTGGVGLDFKNHARGADN